MKKSKSTDSRNVPEARKNYKRVLLFSLLLAIPASIYFIFFALPKDGSISFHGLVAHGLAVILAFLSAFLFMGIMFFSARSGHDEQPNYREIIEKQRTREKIDTQDKL